MSFRDIEGAKRTNMRGLLMSGTKPNPTARALTSLMDPEGCVQGLGHGTQAQPTRPDDHDDSHLFDRQRDSDDRPPLYEDPKIHM